MKDMSIRVRELSRATFAAFGDVIEARGESLEINQGTTRRFHDLAQLDLVESGGRPLFNIFRAKPRPRPIQVKLMERHPLSSQAFFPLDNKPYLVLVAPPGEKIDINSMQAFLAHGRQGVNYHRNVWHHPLLALDEETDFIVIDRGAEDENCDEYYFPAETSIVVDV